MEGQKGRGGVRQGGGEHGAGQVKDEDSGHELAKCSSDWGLDVMIK